MGAVQSSSRGTEEKFHKKMEIQTKLRFIRNISVTDVHFFNLTEANNPDYYTDVLQSLGSVPKVGSFVFVFSGAVDQTGVPIRIKSVQINILDKIFSIFSNSYINVENGNVLNVERPVLKDFPFITVVFSSTRPEDSVYYDLLFNTITDQISNPTSLAKMNKTKQCMPFVEGTKRLHYPLPQRLTCHTVLLTYSIIKPEHKDTFKYIVSYSTLEMHRMLMHIFGVIKRNNTAFVYQLANLYETPFNKTYIEKIVNTAHQAGLFSSCTHFNYDGKPFIVLNASVNGSLITFFDAKLSLSDKTEMFYKSPDSDAIIAKSSYYVERTIAQILYIKIIIMRSIRQSTASFRSLIVVVVASTLDNQKKNQNYKRISYHVRVEFLFFFSFSRAHFIKFHHGQK